MRRAATSPSGHLQIFSLEAASRHAVRTLPIARRSEMLPRKRLSAKAKRARLELRLGELKREIDRLVDAIAKGHGDPAVLEERK
jgi:hypothetical protein